MPIANAAYNSLEESFKPIVWEILTRLEALGYQPYVCEGRRTVEQQREKVRKGYSKTMKSYHLTGNAADIVDKRYMWNIPLTHQYWIDYGTIVKELQKENPTLRWGGDWNVPGRFEILKKKGKITWFSDCAHLEIR